MKPDCKGRRLRRTAAVVPVAMLAWLGLGIASGSAFAAPENNHGVNGAAASASAGAAASNGNGNGNPASNGNGNGASNGNGNGNGNASSNDAGNGNPDAPGQAKKQDAPGPGMTSGSVDSSTASANGNSNSNAASHSSQGTAGTVGDPTKPQPQSNADKNAGGANNGGNCGAYCSTRDGSASQNGNGNGKAKGKPCAGCVGKADNKNPKGQRPNGNDHNNGYECDGNHGIGKGNPAHTACTPSNPDCHTTNTCGNPDCHTTNTCGNPDCHTTNTCGNPDCHATNSCGGGGDCNTVGNCPGGDCTTTDTCPKPDCKATHSCPTHEPKCVPTKANNFCTHVKGRTHHRTTVVKTPTVVLGEKVTKTPDVLPFTGAPLAAMLGWSLLSLALGGLLLMVGSRRFRQRTTEVLVTIESALRARPVAAAAVATAGGGHWRPDPCRRQVGTATRSTSALGQRPLVSVVGWTDVRHPRRF